jgi:hypothetical protein
MQVAVVLHNDDVGKLGVEFKNLVAEVSRRDIALDGDSKDTRLTLFKFTSPDAVTIKFSLLDRSMADQRLPSCRTWRTIWRVPDFDRPLACKRRSACLPERTEFIGSVRSADYQKIVIICGDEALSLDIDSRSLPKFEPIDLQDFVYRKLPVAAFANQKIALLERELLVFRREEITGFS